MPPDIMSGELTLITMTVDLPLYASPDLEFWSLLLFQVIKSSPVNCCSKCLYIYILCK